MTKQLYPVTALLIAQLIACTPPKTHVGENIDESKLKCPISENCTQLLGALLVRYKVLPLDDHKYRIDGSASLIQANSYDEALQLGFDFFLIKDKIVAQTEKITINGNLMTPLTFNREFVGKSVFDHVFIGRVSGYLKRD